MQESNPNAPDIPMQVERLQSIKAKPAWNQPMSGNNPAVLSQEQSHIMVPETPHHTMRSSMRSSAVRDDHVSETTTDEGQQPSLFQSDAVVLPFYAVRPKDSGPLSREAFRERLESFRHTTLPPTHASSAADSPNPAGMSRKRSRPIPESPDSADVAPTVPSVPKQAAAAEENLAVLNALRAMFPNVPPIVLAKTLFEHGGNIEQATNAMLSMTTTSATSSLPRLMPNMGHPMVPAVALAPVHLANLQQLRNIFPYEMESVLLDALKRNQFQVQGAIHDLLTLRAVSPQKQISRPMVPYPIPQRVGRPAKPYVPTKPSKVKPPPSKKKRFIVSSDDDESMSERSTSDEDSDGGDSSASEYASPRREANHLFVLNFFNTATAQQIQDVTGCTKAQSVRINEMQPFESYDHLYSRLNETKGLSTRILEKYEDTMTSFEALDELINKCESIMTSLMAEIQKWGAQEPDGGEKKEGDGGAAHEAMPVIPAQSTKKPKRVSKGDDDDTTDDDEDDSGLHLVALSQQALLQDDSDDGLLRKQPDFVNPDLTLKGYQLLGVSWLYLLYRRGLSGCLADSMGLGKSAQVITFLGLLHSKGIPGPHLIVVPSSTTENWLREFERWCPSLDVRLYYGNQDERALMRDDLGQRPYEFNVIVTTYNMISGADDRKFLRKVKFDCLVLDEGHMVKNMNSQRYKHLMSIRTPHRYLLTGTPMQNNLQELISLLTFLMPDMFMANEEDLKRLFFLKNQDDLLESKQRIQRAKSLMKPFILRRSKQQVLKDLPSKTEELLRCEPTKRQLEQYRALMTNSRKTYIEDTKGQPGNATNKLNNILMQLRKMACHPALHRNHFTESKLKTMSKELLKHEDYSDANPELIYDDMTYLSDFELHRLCVKFSPLKRFKLTDDVLLDSGKVQVLLKVLEEEKKKDSRVLLFSQFTMMLDVLEEVLQMRGYKFLRIDGSTPVPERQERIDLFYQDTSYFVFLLSTKAGGFGINLTAANVVVLHDLDFNPHNDNQAEDRAHRVGQTRDVKIVKLITKGTVEEQIYRCGLQKLKLDKTVSAHGNVDESPTTTKKKGRTSDEENVDQATIMSILRAEFLNQEQSENDLQKQD